MTDFTRPEQVLYSGTSFWLESLFTECPRRCRVFLQAPFVKEEDVYQTIIHNPQIQTRLCQYARQLHHVHAGPAFITHDLTTLPLILWPGDTEYTLAYFASCRVRDPHYVCRPPSDY